MSADKHKKRPRWSELIAWVWDGYENRRIVSGRLSRDIQRLIDLGLVTTKRRRSWSAFGSHIRRTFLELTKHGEVLAKVLAAPPTKITPPHKREPRAEKKRPRPSDRRRMQAE